MDKKKNDLKRPGKKYTTREIGRIVRRMEGGGIKPSRGRQGVIGRTISKVVGKAKKILGKIIGKKKK